MGFSRQEYWSGLPLPSPGDLPGPGIKPRSPVWHSRQILYRGPPGKHVRRGNGVSRAWAGQQGPCASEPGGAGDPVAGWLTTCPAGMSRAAGGLSQGGPDQCLTLWRVQAGSCHQLCQSWAGIIKVTSLCTSVSSFIKWGICSSWQWQVVGSSRDGFPLHLFENPWTFSQLLTRWLQNHRGLSVACPRA